MSRRTLLLLLAAVVLFGSACLCFPLDWLAYPPDPPVKTPQPDQAATLPPLDLQAHELSADELPICLERLPQLLVEAEQTDYPGIELPMDYTVAEFAVSGDALLSPEYPSVPVHYGLETYQDDAARQQQIWQYVVDVIPARERTLLARFILFTDGVSGSLGAIEQTDDPSLWSLQLDILDASYYPLLSTTLIHEFAHLMTVQDVQLDLNQELGGGKPAGGPYPACDNYQMFEGCSTDGSYLTLFFDRFWPEIYAEWLEIDAIETEADRDLALERFYDRRVDQFVSWYAPTNPEEDLAESFMYFVFAGRPSGDTLAEQKILFFYEFPELVDLRQQFQSSLCAYLPTQ